MDGERGKRVIIELPPGKECSHRSVSHRAEGRVKADVAMMWWRWSFRLGFGALTRHHHASRVLWCNAALPLEANCAHVSSGAATIGPSGLRTVSSAGLLCRRSHGVAEAEDRKLGDYDVRFPFLVCERDVRSGAGAADEFDCACRDCGRSAGVSGDDMASVCSDNGDEDSQRGLRTSAGSPLFVAAVGGLDSLPAHACTPMQAFLEWQYALLCSHFTLRSKV